MRASTFTHKSISSINSGCKDFTHLEVRQGWVRDGHSQHQGSCGRDGKSPNVCFKLSVAPGYALRSVQATESGESTVAELAVATPRRMLGQRAHRGNG